MGDDTKIQVEGKGIVKLEHGVFKKFLYVPSLEANMLYVYQMTNTGSPKRVVFEPDLVEISNISIGKMIVEGVANHASKEYEFSHFFSVIKIQCNLYIQLKGNVNSFYLNHFHVIMVVTMLQNSKLGTKLNQFLELRMKFN